MTDDVLDHSRRKFFYFGAAALFASLTTSHAMAQSVSNKLKIGVIGSGHIGGTIGGLWVKAGHSVLFSSRHPEELKPLTDSLGPLAKAGPVGVALARAEEFAPGRPLYGQQLPGQGLRERFGLAK